MCSTRHECSCERRLRSAAAWPTGRVGQHGSIAIVERFIRTLKDEGTRRTEFQRQLTHFVVWYNEHRPHGALDGRTPNEVYLRLRPADRRPRIEPRQRWLRRSPCAGPQTLIAGQPGDWFTVNVEFLGGQRQLPIISLKRAA